MKRNLARRFGRTLAAALALAFPGPVPQAHADVPRYLNYQGKLADASGNPLTGSYCFKFQIWDSLTGGSLLFGPETWSTNGTAGGNNPVSVVNGIYSLQIGSLTAGGIASGVFDNADAFLEVAVNADSSNCGTAETLSPREHLVAVPYAVHSLTSEKLGTGVYIATFTSAGNLQLVSGSTITSNGTLTISTAATAATAAPNLFISNDGNVGIGTTIPGYKLDVQEDGQVNASGGLCLAGACQTNWLDGARSLLSSTNTWSAQQTFLNQVTISTNINLSGGSNPALFYIPAGLASVNRPRFTSASSGYLGWELVPGTDGGSGFGLSASSDILNTARAGWWVTSGGTYLSVFGMGSVAGGPLIFQLSASGDALERMRISTSGYVGIGTTGPSATLEVSSAPAGGTTNPVLIVSTGSADSQRLLVVQGDGNVGIGTTAPASSLHVQSPTTQSNAVIIATGTVASQYLVVFSTSGGVNLKSDGANAGSLQVGYSTNSPAGYYSVYAP